MNNCKHLPITLWAVSSLQPVSPSNSHQPQATTRKPVGKYIFFLVTCGCQGVADWSLGCVTGVTSNLLPMYYTRSESSKRLDKNLLKPEMAENVRPRISTSTHTVPIMTMNKILTLLQLGLELRTWKEVLEPWKILKGELKERACSYWLLFIVLKSFLSHTRSSSC